MTRQMQNFAEKSAVIFDMDGLLIDSEPFWDRTHEAFFAKHNLPDSPEIRQKMHGAGVSDNIKLLKRELGLTGDVTLLTDEYRSLFYGFALKDMTLMPGARHLLHCLSENNFRLAIATGGHTEKMISEIVTKLDIAEYFPTHITSDMVEKGKPDPAVYLKTAEVLQINPDECIVLEDSVNGTKSGKAAGMTVIGVSGDTGYQKKLLTAGADLVADRLDDLIPLFAGGCCGGDCCKD